MQIIDNKTYKQQIRSIAKELSVREGSILITGATGMIGSCLVDVLIEANISFGCGFKIYALGRDQERLADRFSYAESYPFLNYIVQDIKEPLSIQASLDYIVHAASNADPRSYALHPADTMLINVLGTKQILDYCKQTRHTRVLFTSTFEVYGRNDATSVYRESTEGSLSLDSVRSCYPESKRCAEVLLKCYQQEYGVDYVVARLCSIYGPTMALNDSKAHAEFIMNGLHNQEIVLKSGGQQKRTYCYLMDAVSGLLTILFAGKSGEAYNVSNEQSIVSIAELAAMIAEIFGQRITYKEPTATENRGYSRAQDCILDNTRLRSLGWNGGGYSLRDGLLSTIEILRERVLS